MCEIDRENLYYCAEGEVNGYFKTEVRNKKGIKEIKGLKCFALRSIYRTKIRSRFALAFIFEIDRVDTKISISGVLQDKALAM